ncbi:unnamed protein product [Euphydryas editha]|uniref:Transposable element P transposase-like GTP-binding insertion domain-containing protein n=1 Tax=Euphydryas editha TaxID=104508 RepID=A0AAU9TPE6_EUPED|nr:unnamed protein product [Euphydryas editha]
MVRKTSKWSHLVQLLKENPGYKGIRLIPKLTEHHLNPEKLNKMKVKFASQVFSRTVASNMVYLADKGILPTECIETADLLLFMDNVFDSVNGSHAKNKNAKPLLGPVTLTSAHIKIWTEAKRVFNSMEFVTPASRKCLERKQRLQTGGGPPAATDPPTGDDTAVWLPHEFTIDSNEFDSDNQLLNDNKREEPELPIIVLNSPLLCDNAEPEIEMMSQPGTSTKTERSVQSLWMTDRGHQQITYR